MIRHNLLDTLLALDKPYDESLHNQVRGSLGTAESSLLNVKDTFSPEYLVQSNIRLVAYLAKRYTNTGHEIEELISEGLVGLVKASQNFDESRGLKFSTFASHCIENEIKMFLRKENKQKRFGCMYFDDVISVDFMGNELTLDDIVSDKKDYEDAAILDLRLEKLNEFIDQLGPREKTIVEDYMNDVQQWVTAQKLGVSQSYISRLQRRIADKLIVKYGVSHKKIKPTTLEGKRTRRI